MGKMTKQEKILIKTKETLTQPGVPSVGSFELNVDKANKEEFVKSYEKMRSEPSEIFDGYELKLFKQSLDHDMVEELSKDLGVDQMFDNQANVTHKKFIFKIIEKITDHEFRETESGINLTKKSPLEKK